MLLPGSVLDAGRRRQSGRWLTLLNVGHQECRETAVGNTARAWSRHAGRSVLSGATTPNRKLRAAPVASLPVIVAVLSIHFESIVRAAVPY